jgi:phosphoglucosamine mutase
MLSASHNPAADNGVKLFAPGGRKLDDTTEEKLEAVLDEITADPTSGGRSSEVGSLTVDGTGAALYADAVLASIEGRDLGGLRVVIDCAAGASSHLAPLVLARAGAQVTAIHADPAAEAINDGCGSTHPESLQAAVVEAGADVGLAFDGDADRVLAVAADGTLIDGDHVIALCARDLRDRGRLAHDTVVVTVMTNLGFRLAMAEAGIEVVETPVGDRYVLEAMEKGGFSLGGEQSGHVIFGDLATTGDGLLTGLQLIDIVARAGRPLGDMAAEVMQRLPQVLENVRVDGDAAAAAKGLAGAASEAEAALGGRGRVLVRASGTEPMVRIMVEAPTEAEAAAVATRLRSLL